MKSLFKALLMLAGTSIVLGGCAVYGPPPAYSQGPYYQQMAPVYAQPGYGYYSQPAPVYVEPAPVYVAPPVSFGFNFGWWGGHHHHRH